MRERDLLEDPGVDGRIILRWIFRKWVGGVWTGLIWLRIETGGGFRKIWGIPGLSETRLSFSRRTLLRGVVRK
jgi:hypothetical protein